MTVDLLITNAIIVNADSTIEGHIAVSGGRIAALYDSATSAELLPAAARTLDAAGRTVIPGGVDSHAHVEQVTGAYKSLDTYETASIAALWGGTTTIMDFGIPADLSETPLAAAENKIRLAEVSRCDVALHGAVIDWDETVPAQLDRLAELGIRSVKMYTTNRGSTMANGDTIVKVMREMVRLDGLTYIHAEHDPIIVDCLAQHGINEHGVAGPVPAGRLHHTRPELAEAASVAEVLSMAEYTGAPVYFVHQTIPEAVALVQDARSRGLEAYSETCPHYLTLDEEVYASEFPESFSCCPPIRSRETVMALLERVRAGEVHTISSDHSCYDLTQKQSRSEDVRFMPHGLPGIETRMPVAFTTLVVEQGMAVQQFVELFAAAPARINTLPGKGIIAPGYDADLVIFDPEEVRTVDGTALHMGTDFSPFDGMELAGWPATVVMGGRVVLDGGEFTDPGPTGRFLNRYDTGKTAALAGKAL
ncbi:amidohydrolase family protein [Paeniglutamicibacter antarcticus]|uniref:Amidohydrolase family protein n=1 Tax=Arthrobacter terrae TaxID=2935737 RepID=A0A931CNC3_9MICC|nr:amidohydrolase family protein [Arthrobacter terrae]MBG0738559.1 amidohydrolase family protein [Arthrobacter terrae]